MRKCKKRIVITSEAKNSLGFRVRTAGIDLAEYNANPLMLFMHKRPKGENVNEVLPLGNVIELKVEADGKITGLPVFDDTDAFAVKIADKVDNGTIRMASAGLKPLHFSDNKEWLEKSVLKEISIVDIGSNAEALTVALYNDSDELITLAEFSTKKENPKTDTNMKLLQLSATTIGLLKLADGATEAEAHTAILNLVTLSATQKTQIATLTTAKETAENKLADQVKLAGNAKLIALVDEAASEGVRKITEDQKPHFIKMGFETAEALLKTMSANPTAASQMQKAAGAATEGLMKLSYDELDKSGQLITLKEQNLDGFKEKFKSKFGSDYASAE